MALDFSDLKQILANLEKINSKQHDLMNELHNKIIQQQRQENKLNSVICDLYTELENTKHQNKRLTKENNSLKVKIHELEEEFLSHLRQ